MEKKERPFLGRSSVAARCARHCVCIPTVRREEKKRIEVCVRERDGASVHVTTTTVFLIYDRHLHPGCRFVGGAEGGEA